MGKKSKFLIAVAGVVLCFSMLVVAEEGTSAINMTVDPFRADVVIEPGTNYLLGMNMVNNGNGAVHAAIEFKEFELDSNGIVSIKEPSGDDSPVYWLSLDTTEFVLAAGEEKEQDLAINLPEGIPARGNYVAVVYTFAKTAEDLSEYEDNQELGVDTVVRVQSLLSIITGEDIIESGSVSLEVVEELGKPVKIITTVKNAGDIHFVPQGKVTINNGFGGVTEELSINSENGRVLPGGERVWENELDMSLAFGGYTVVAELTAGTHGLVMEDTVSFNSYSLASLIALGVIVVFVVGVIVLVKAKRVKRKDVSGEHV